MMVETVDRLLFALLRFNPCVAWHELRMRMRVGRAFVALLVYVLFASLAVAVPVGFVAWEQSVYTSMPPRDLGRIGLHALVYTELSLVFIVIPAYAAAAIASERERQTLEMLRATLLSPWDVVTGKLLSVLAMAAVLLGTTVPVAAWCLLLGGVSPAEVYRVFLLMFVTAAWVAALGVFMSARCERTLGAIVATYGTIIGLSVLSALVSYFVFAVYAMSMSSGNPTLGPVAGAICVGVPVLLTAWLGALLARWLIARVPFLGRFFRRPVSVGIIAAALFAALMLRAFPLVDRLSLAAPTALALMNPYVAAAATLEESVTREMIQPTYAAPTPTAAPSTAHWPARVWAVLMWVYCAFAAALWVGATRVYARQAAT
ncbi:MAG: ABC transporter permease [Armatimonadota bacterium]